MIQTVLVFKGIPLCFLPLLFSYAGIVSGSDQVPDTDPFLFPDQAFVSIGRINDFMNSPEIDPDSVKHTDTGPDDRPQAGDPVVKIQRGRFSWTPDSPPVIDRIDLVVGRRNLVAIIGAVGSGKSSLLSAILGEMERLEGLVEVSGKIAYVPQEAWIRNATIRENILLNKRYDEKKYQEVLEACALNFDMAMFAAGDQTEVGEKGINLSGGQKQRISIARAVYSNSDIYIMDNPLR